MDNIAHKKPVKEGGGGAGMTAVARSYLKHKSSLMRYIGRFLHRPQDIEDIVHETFLRTYASEINTQIRSPKAFLFRTARNLALKHLDKSSNKLTDYMGDIESLEVSVDEISTENRVDSQEQFVEFCRAVRTLPLQCRRAFILRKVYGFTHKEIAEQLEISVNTVERHLANGIIKCNQYMRSRGYSYNQTGAGNRARGEGSDR